MSRVLKAAMDAAVETARKIEDSSNEEIKSLRAKMSELMLTLREKDIELASLKNRLGDIERLAEQTGGSGFRAKEDIDRGQFVKTDEAGMASPIGTASSGGVLSEFARAVLSGSKCPRCGCRDMIGGRKCPTCELFV